MKATLYEYKGYNYLVYPLEIKHLPYEDTVKTLAVYTNNPKWASKIIPEIIEDKSISKGLRELKLKKNPNDVATALRPYHTVELVEDNQFNLSDVYGVELDDTCYYKYTIIEPYDD